MLSSSVRTSPAVTTSPAQTRFAHAGRPIRPAPAKLARMPSALPARDDTHLGNERPRACGAGEQAYACPGATRPRVPKSVLPPRRSTQGQIAAFSIPPPCREFSVWTPAWFVPVSTGSLPQSGFRAGKEPRRTQEASGAPRAHLAEHPHLAADVQSPVPSPLRPAPRPATVCYSTHFRVL
jgi:hypothetical protein